MRLKDTYKVKRQNERAVYTESTYVVVVEQSISTSSEYDIFHEIETLTEYRHKVPAMILWSPRLRYIGVNDTLLAKAADVTLTKIPDEHRALFEANILLEVPNDSQTSRSSCTVVQLVPDNTGAYFTVYAQKRNQV